MKRGTPGSGTSGARSTPRRKPLQHEAGLPHPLGEIGRRQSRRSLQAWSTPSAGTCRAGRWSPPRGLPPRGLHRWWRPALAGPWGPSFESHGRRYSPPSATSTRSVSIGRAASAEATSPVTTVSPGRAIAIRRAAVCVGAIATRMPAARRSAATRSAATRSSSAPIACASPSSRPSPLTSSTTQAARDARSAVRNRGRWPSGRLLLLLVGPHSRAPQDSTTRLRRGPQAPAALERRHAKSRGGASDPSGPRRPVPPRLAAGCAGPARTSPAPRCRGWRA